MEQSASASEIVLLQLYLGSPVFGLAALILAFFLRSHLKISWLSVLFAVLSCSAVALATSIVIWYFWPSAFGDIMAVQFVNLPALLASIPVFAIVGLFLYYRQKPNNGMQPTG
jgi:membrane-bound metal-dependent hydrolase YbcI (DUF457 family)